MLDLGCILVALLVFSPSRASELVTGNSGGGNSSVGKDIPTVASHAFSQDGEPKYPMNFKNFDYVNPDAPKGGTLRRSSVQSSYNSLNPELPECDVKAPGLRNMFGALMNWSMDDYSSVYPNVAQGLHIAVDKSFVIFDLNKNAEFNDPTNDGCDPKNPAKREKVTADDVKFSFEAMKTHGEAGAKSYFKDIESVDVLDEHRIKFTIKPEKYKSAIIAASTFNIYSKKFHANKATPFSRCSRDPIPGTGAYVVEKANEKSIKYKHACNYWAENLPSRKGHDNFEHLNYEIYRDGMAAEGSFRNKETDFQYSMNLNRWPDDVTDVTKGKNAYQDARTLEAIKNKEVTLHQLSTPYDGYVREMAFNSTNPVLKDRRVRNALALLSEPEFMSTDIDRGRTKPGTTYFPAAKPALVSEEKVKELLLQQKRLHGDQFPDAALQGKAPIDATGKPYSALFRERAKEADRLMREAGWTLQNDPDGSNKKVWMKGAKKFPDLLAPTLNPSSYIVYKKRLEQFGIGLELRQVDQAQITQIQSRNQYDLMTRRIRHDPVPGPELSGLWGSEAAKQTAGSNNLTRTSSPVIDELSETVINAKTGADRQNALEALNRVMKAESPSVLLPAATSSIYVAKRSNVGGAKPLPTSGQISTASIVEDTWWDHTLPTPKK